jgi:hypothetical protein
MEGIIKVRPVIKKISFDTKAKITIILEDGRFIIVPLYYFPSIKKLTMLQKRKWYILDDQMFSFDDCNEVFHIEQILGKEAEYSYHF